MQTRYEFPLEDIERFEMDHGLSFEIDDTQVKEKDGYAVAHLTVEQLTSMASLILQSLDEKEYFIMGIRKFQPFSVSMFVFNDAVWNLMSKKEESPETMLPMVTMPCFYWDKEAIDHNNPQGVRRDHQHQVRLTLEPMKRLTVLGDGGDFCGIVDSQLADRRQTGRSLIMPNLPEQKRLVPKYAYQDLAIEIGLKNISKDLYPRPRNEIDYTYSAHPRIFYEHGLSITIDGSNVHLKVGRRRPLKMNGKTLILFGKEWDKESNGQDILEYHVWLAYLFQMI